MSRSVIPKLYAGTYWSTTEHIKTPSWIQLLFNDLDAERIFMSIRIWIYGVQFPPICTCGTPKGPSNLAHEQNFGVFGSAGRKE